MKQYLDLLRHITDDWFDLDKVETVLKEIDPLQKIFNQNRKLQ